jgi:ketosteroid isomerase-like protein
MLRNLMKIVIIAGVSGILLQCKNTDHAKGKEEIINTDKAFSDLSKEQGMKHAFLEYAAEDVVILRKNSLPQSGKKMMEDRFASFSDTGFVLTWEPLYADVASSGELGYSYGIYTSTSSDSTGNPLIEKGTYMSVWKKDNAGQWRFVLDSGNEGLGEQQ